MAIQRIDLGLVGIVDKGEYDPTTTYNKGNFVWYVESSYICLLNNTVGVTPSDDGTNWKYLARGAGSMARKVISLTQNAVTASGDSLFPYYYDIYWPGCETTKFCDAAIYAGTYTSSFKVESMAGKVRVSFSDPLSSGISMIIFVSDTEAPENGDGYFIKDDSTDTVWKLGIKDGAFYIKESEGSGSEPIYIMDDSDGTVYRIGVNEGILYTEEV